MTGPEIFLPSGCAISSTGKYKTGEADFFLNTLPAAEAFELGPEELFWAWEVAGLTGDDNTAEERKLLATLALAVLAASRSGGTRLALQPAGRFYLLMEQLGLSEGDRMKIIEALDALEKNNLAHNFYGANLIIGSAGEYKPLILDRHSLYLQRMHLLEERVGRLLVGRITAGAGREKQAGLIPLDRQFEKALKEVIKAPPVGPDGPASLDSSQLEAVRSSLGGLITVISGKPGSGKTSITATILRVLARTRLLPLETIALASPTGKAADRMQRSIVHHLASVIDAAEADSYLADNCPPASTLHRLLGYNPASGRFSHNENNPLPEKLVIVDESSMISLAMMDSLLQALHPEARIIFLGDSDQLPSIEAGAVLRDLCRSALAKQHGRAVTLRNSYRAKKEEESGISIINTADAFKAGVVPTAEEHGPITFVSEPSRLSYSGVEMLAVKREAEKELFFKAWLERLAGADPGFAALLTRSYRVGVSGFEPDARADLRRVVAASERFKILCATRVTTGRTGSDSVNEWFYRNWIHYLDQQGISYRQGRYLPGEPVLVTKNDYRLQLYNGDSGLMLHVAGTDTEGTESTALMAVFPRGDSFIFHPPYSLQGKLEPAWAITVHKAQGSEYDNVAFLLPDRAIRTLSKELIYTAVSRAKKSAVILGETAVLREGLNNTSGRDSGLTELLKI